MSNMVTLLTVESVRVKGEELVLARRERLGGVLLLVLPSSDRVWLRVRVCFPNRTDILRSDGSRTRDTRFAARVLFHSSACSSGVSGAV